MTMAPPAHELLTWKAFPDAQGTVVPLVLTVPEFIPAYQVGSFDDFAYFV
jgi:hypothetical protein